jgi:hypothetical protein
VSTIQGGWQKCRPSFLEVSESGFIRLLYVILFISSSCTKNEIVNTQIYEGPIREAANIEMLHSENEKVTIKLQAKKVSEFQNGDRNFPEGIYMEFYDEFGKITSTLSANKAF